MNDLKHTIWKKLDKEAIEERENDKGSLSVPTTIRRNIKGKVGKKDGVDSDFSTTPLPTSPNVGSEGKIISGDADLAWGTTYYISLEAFELFMTVSDHPQF